MTQYEYRFGVDEARGAMIAEPLSLSPMSVHNDICNIYGSRVIPFQVASVPHQLDNSGYRQVSVAGQPPLDHMHYCFTFSLVLPAVPQCVKPNYQIDPDYQKRHPAAGSW